MSIILTEIVQRNRLEVKSKLSLVRSSCTTPVLFIQWKHKQAAANNSVNPGPSDGISDPGHNEEQHLTSEFDGSSKALWTLFGTEAKSYDNARINTLKDDMDGVLIFVCLYSMCLLWTFMLTCDITHNRLVYFRLRSQHL